MNTTIVYNIVDTDMNHEYKSSVKGFNCTICNLLKTNLAVRIVHIDHSPVYVSYKTRLLH